MADNVTFQTTVATPPSGTVVATDDVGGVHYQLMKLADGTADSTTTVRAGNGVAANALRVTLASDGTGVVAATQSGTWNIGTISTVSGTVTVDSELPAAAALADASANPTTPLVGAALELFNGTTWDRARGDTTNGLDVDVTRLPALAAGTNNIGDIDVLTVPAPLSTTGGGTEAAALRVTIANDSTGVVSIDDNGSSLTVDGTVGISGTVTVDSELTIADLDLGAGTDTRAVVGLVGSKSGGAQLIPGDATAGLKVDLGADNDVTVTGSVTANAGTNLNTSALALESGGNLATIAGAVRAEDVASADGHTGIPALMVRKATPANTSGTDGDYEMLQGSGGRLWVDASGVTLTVGSHAVTNAGTFAVQESGSALTALQLIDDTVFADDAAFTVASSKVNAVGFMADETSTDSVDEGDIGIARITLDRKQIATLYAHAAAGGGTPYQNLDVDETEDDVKTSAGKVFWVHAMNLSTGKRYLKFYNDTAANVIVGTTTPKLTLPIPTMGDTNGAGFTINFGDIGCQFDTAICIAATTGFAVADTGAPGANDVIVNLAYA